MKHVPVLLNEVVENLNLRLGSKIIDCTLGDAGHSEKILNKIIPKGKLLGIDADPEAILRAKQYLYDFFDNVILVRDNFENLKKVVEENDFQPVDGILMDLGWSTPQFADRGRGFSFQNKAESLDMRYSEKVISTAADILSNRTQNELAKIFKDYGEEKFNREIAEEIFKVRKTNDFKTVGDLVEVILQVYRKKLKTDKDIPWIGGLHPATKVFQALRIEVNDELGALKRVLPQAVEVLAPGGRLVVITFHSLEDRIVKHYFKEFNNKTLKIINKKPIVCSPEEAKNNPPSRSAKLRVIEKI